MSAESPGGREGVGDVDPKDEPGRKGARGGDGQQDKKISLQANHLFQSWVVFRVVHFFAAWTQISCFGTCLNSSRFSGGLFKRR